MTSVVPQSITPQTVAGCLKRAGFDASKTSTTGVRGWHDVSQGFKCTINYVFLCGSEREVVADGVLVTYRTGGQHHRPEWHAIQIDAMKGALEKEFKVEHVQKDNGRGFLIVRPKDEGLRNG